MVPSSTSLPHSPSSHSPMEIGIFRSVFFKESACLSCTLLLHWEGEAEQITPGCPDGLGELPNFTVFVPLQKESHFQALKFQYMALFPLLYMYSCIHFLRKKHSVNLNVQKCIGFFLLCLWWHEFGKKKKILKTKMGQPRKALES